MEELEKLTNHELEVLCDKAGVSKKGGKEDMYQRLSAAGAFDSKPKAKAKAK